ncbi:FAD-dependent oxidoreductase [Acidianus sp. HS-5]|uniref:FAD-dependent oxidoreductase n=1 Tax=Acidianus sp. HS-5 TaxID=2886040 RepID=UPI001F36F88E|nr:FAD-dependent oxidoreductase [Acidianus sp. HS-5]BDC19423.1 oxidoreductase [Acidianus sp. HS-5]
MAKILSKCKVGNKLIVKFDEKIQFNPGNTIDVIIDNDRRTFSIASTPWESFIMIATKIRNSPFKQKLLILKEGDEVKIEGPYQDEFVIKDSPKHVFITKGIGITPVRSMVLYLLKNSQDAAIYYQPDDDGVILFKEDLNSAMKIEQLDNKIFKENQDAMFYISGEPEFTKEATKIAVDNGIKPGKILVEPFSGY